MKLMTPRWRTPLVLVGLLLLAATIAPAALAAPSTATASVAPTSPPADAGATESYTFSLAPSSGQIGSFNLTAPTGWSITGLVGAPAGITSTATQIQGRQLNISSSSPLSLTFTAQAPCSPATATWAVAAKTGANFNGASFSITPQPMTTLAGSCTAAFVSGRGPADAAFNGGTKSQNITSVPFTPGGAAMQVIVKDAAGQPRAGIAIELKLVCDVSDCDDGAKLTGPVTATSASDDPATPANEKGLATFTGTTSNPIAIDAVGIGYRLDPTGTGVTSTPSSGFGIYEEGENCGATCSVRGRSGDRDIDATVAADTPSGSLSVLVSELGLDCAASVPAGYEYVPLSADVIAWKYTGTGSQTISVRVDRSLLVETDRGSAHIDVCYLAEPHPVTGDVKTFTSKFGGPPTSGPALLPTCGPTIDENCIVSQTAASGGDRIVTFTVEDGRGKI